jgi:DNA-binding helix-hairpin-helix protein with protein kinase domain
MNARLTSTRGGPVRLGRELGRGGEGAVFEIADHSDFVAKIYHLTPDRNKADKLVAMANGCTDRLRSISAWPIDTIHDATGGAVRGFVMRRVARQKDIHVLYGPKTRLRDYPDATYRFLVHVAANVARAFAVVHEHGHVIGDVNQGGVCVSAQGTVTLVDCDSFQVRASQRVFGCDVGIPIYQPPEFQTLRSFHGLPRTPNHDTFGLAVLIFQTLFLARHPFAGAFQGDGEMPIERAIRELRFAYGRDAARRQMKQPPGSLGLGAVPLAVAELFERAFLEVGARGNRPMAIEWVTALDGFLSELRECQQNPGHAFAQTLTMCPLCAVEGRAGVLLFLPPRQAAVKSPPLNLDDLWRELVPIIASARMPAVSHASLPALPPPDAVVEFKRAKSRASIVLWLGIAASVMLAMIWHPGALAGATAFPIVALMMRGRTPDEARNLDLRLSAARERFDSIVRHIERERMTSVLPQLEARAEVLYRGLQAFPQRRADRLRSLDNNRFERQMRHFLDQFEVKDARLKGFGPGLFATLVSNGIETADDVAVDRLAGVRGFGPKRINALLDWRRNVEARFRFNPSDPADAQERARVERELQLESVKEVAELRQVAEQIKAHAGPLRQRIAMLAGELGQAQEELAIVHATAAALGKAA